MSNHPKCTYCSSGRFYELDGELVCSKCQKAQGPLKFDAAIRGRPRGTRTYSDTHQKELARAEMPRTAVMDKPKEKRKVPIILPGDIDTSKAKPDGIHPPIQAVDDTLIKLREKALSFVRGHNLDVDSKLTTADLIPLVMLQLVNKHKNQVLDGAEENIALGKRIKELESEVADKAFIIDNHTNTIKAHLGTIASLDDKVERLQLRCAELEKEIGDQGGYADANLAKEKEIERLQKLLRSALTEAKQAEILGNTLGDQLEACRKEDTENRIQIFDFNEKCRVVGDLDRNATTPELLAHLLSGAKGTIEHFREKVEKLSAPDVLSQSDYRQAMLRLFIANQLVRHDDEAELPEDMLELLKLLCKQHQDIILSSTMGLQQKVDKSESDLHQAHINAIKAQAAYEAMAEIVKWHIGRKA